MLQSIGIDFHASGVDNVIGAIGRLKRSLRGLKGFTTGAGAEGVVGAGGGRRPSPHSWRGAGFFMARWFGVYKTAELASKGVTQILLSGAREGIDKAMMEVEAVAFTTKHKRELEFAANRFISKFSDTTKEELVKAMSQVASALDVEKWGVDELWRAVKGIAHMAKLSKIQLEPAAEFVAQTYAAAKNMAEFKGLAPGAAMEKISAMMTKIVQISMGWTQAFSHAFRYALPGFEQLGMTFAQSQALVAVFKDIGFHAGQIGRGWRYFTQQAEEPFAKILLAGDPRGQMWEEAQPGLRGKKLRALKTRNAQRLRAASAYVRDRMLKDPLHFLEELSAAARTAWERGITAVKLGLSARWNPMFIKMRDDLFARLNEYLKALGAPGLVREQIQKHAQGLTQPGYALPALRTSFKTLQEAWAMHPYAWQIVTPLKRQMDFMSSILAWQQLLKEVAPDQRLAKTAEMLTKHADELTEQFGVVGFERFRDMSLSMAGLQNNVDLALMKQQILVDNLKDFWSNLAKAFDVDPRIIKAGREEIPKLMESVQNTIDFSKDITEGWGLIMAGQYGAGARKIIDTLKKQYLMDDRKWLETHDPLWLLYQKSQRDRAINWEYYGPPPGGAIWPEKGSTPILPPISVMVEVTGDIASFISATAKAFYRHMQQGADELTGSQGLGGLQP